MTLEQSIQECQTWLETFQTQRRADLHRQQSQMSALESRRTELLELVTRDNADQSSKIELERIEQEIEAVKDSITELRDDFRINMMAKRSEISDTLNQRIAELQDEVTGLRNDKERIRTVQLPALERKREELIESQHTLEAEIRRLVERISELSRINIDTEDLELD